MKIIRKNFSNGSGEIDKEIVYEFLVAECGRKSIHYRTERGLKQRISSYLYKMGINSRHAGKTSFYTKIHVKNKKLLEEIELEELIDEQNESEYGIEKWTG